MAGAAADGHGLCVVSISILIDQIPRAVPYMWYGSESPPRQCSAATDVRIYPTQPHQPHTHTIGGLCAHPHARGLAWRFFLGVLPSSSSVNGEGEEEEEEGVLVEELQAGRARYAEWKAQLYPDFNKVIYIIMMGWMNRRVKKGRGGGMPIFEYPPDTGVKCNDGLKFGVGGSNEWLSILTDRRWFGTIVRAVSLISWAGEPGGGRRPALGTDGRRKRRRRLFVGRERRQWQWRQRGLLAHA